jgi:hypothetical protein
MSIEIFIKILMLKNILPLPMTSMRTMGTMWSMTRYLILSSGNRDWWGIIKMSINYTINWDTTRLSYWYKWWSRNIIIMICSISCSWIWNSRIYWIMRCGLYIRHSSCNSHCNHTHLEDIFFRDFPSFIREESREFFMKFWDDFL